MGCTQSAINNDPSANNNSQKSKNNTKNNNGNNNNNKNGGADANGTAAGAAVVPKTNPYLSLSAKDLYSLKASWKGIRRSLEETGNIMFTKLFENNKDLISQFEKFKDIDQSKLYTSEVFINHTTEVMNELDESITDIDDGDKVHAKLKAIGARHKKHGIISSNIFLEMKGPFLHAIESVLGDRYSDRMRVIYEAVTDYILKTIMEGYEGQ